MAHSTSSSSSSSPSTVVWTIATTMLCHGIVLGSSSAIAQSSPVSDFSVQAIPSSDNTTELDGLSFGLADIQPLSGSTGSMGSSAQGLIATSPPRTPADHLGAAPDGLSFELQPVASAPSVSTTTTVVPLPPRLASLFVGDTHSLVAIAIGCAEGTRTPDGGKTWAFKGHTDPGNGVWNLGTFSWQHGANSPEEADQKQLARLQKQAATLNQQAIALGVPWGLEEQINALDLANQSPSAALNPGGYIERLKQAHDDGLQGSEAILWARTWSYRHPSGTRWNAPGLGNTHNGIRTDQKRRMDEIGKAIAAYSPTSVAAPILSSVAPMPSHSVSIPQPMIGESPIQRQLPQRIKEADIINQLLMQEV